MPAAHPSVPDHLDPEALPASADPYPTYRALAALGIHRRPGGWVVGRPADVAEALGHPHLSVAAAPEPGAPPGGARWWQARMARFTDGVAHTGRRAAVTERLADVEPRVLGDRAAARVRTLLAGGDGARADAMVAARSVPVAVLAEALGLPAAEADRAAVLTAALTAAVAPWRGPRPVVDGDGAARALAAVLGDALGVDARRSTATDAVATAMGLLFQTRDATAGLAGNALVARSGKTRSLDPGAAVGEALRHDPPVHLTRRTATAPLVLGGHRVAPGDTVVALLAAPGEPGSSGPRPEPTWGVGHHRCPGSEVAVALAAGVVAGVEAAGWRPEPGRVTYEPRPNLRVPVRIPLRRVGPER